MVTLSVQLTIFASFSNYFANSYINTSPHVLKLIWCSIDGLKRRDVLLLENLGVFWLFFFQFVSYKYSIISENKKIR